MPLLHSSTSHGEIAFGFYNIEIDALLLDGLFFYCTDFCQVMGKLSLEPGEAEIAGYRFNDPAAIGDFHGAIEGINFTGYMGELFRRWPMPETPDLFRQNLAGEERRDESEAILARHAGAETIICRRNKGGVVEIGAFIFSPGQFLDLIRYVRRGGYPTWEGYEDGKAPVCVINLAAAWGLAHTNSQKA